MSSTSIDIDIGMDIDIIILRLWLSFIALYWLCDHLYK